LERANARWSLDFVHDHFANGRRFRILDIVDDVTRECLAAIPDAPIPGRRVARERTALIDRRCHRHYETSEAGQCDCNSKQHLPAHLLWQTPFQIF
jgi:putative transposase